MCLCHQIESKHNSILATKFIFLLGNFYFMGFRSWRVLNHGFDGRSSYLLHSVWCRRLMWIKWLKIRCSCLLLRSNESYLRKFPFHIVSCLTHFIWSSVRITFEWHLCSMQRCTYIDSIFFCSYRVWVRRRCYRFAYLQREMEWEFSEFIRNSCCWSWFIRASEWNWIGRHTFLVSKSSSFVKNLRFFFFLQMNEWESLALKRVACNHNRNNHSRALNMFLGWTDDWLDFMLKKENSFHSLFILHFYFSFICIRFHFLLFCVISCIMRCINLSLSAHHAPH